MKKMALLLALLMTCFAACVSANAAPLPDSGTFRDFVFLQRDGFTTEITDRYGRVSTFSGVLKVSSLEQHTAVEQMAAYAILCGDEVVLSVQLHDIVSENSPNQYGGVSGKSLTNGFYSVELPVGEGYTAFLTGLSPKYLEEMQASALDAILNDTFVSLEDISFIDTEKQFDVYNEYGESADSDTVMCWAASMSNILFYTGWAKKAGIGSADYMFETLIEEFEDYGGNCEVGLRWFFNGYNLVQNLEGWPSDVSGYDSFRGYVPDYCAQTLVEGLDLTNTPENMSAVLSGLRRGCGVELSFDHYQSWERTDGHSVTLWGMVFRTGSDLSDKGDWKALIISDSDNNVTSGENRRTAPNTLNLYQITPVCFGKYDSWTFDSLQKHYPNGTMYDALVISATLLTPYSDSLETDTGTRDTTTSPDLTVDSIWTIVGDEENYTAYLPADCTVSLAVSVYNVSKSDCTKDVSYEILVVDPESDETPLGGTPIEGTISDMKAGDLISLTTELEHLEPGTYEVIATVTANEDEAYHANNTVRKTFYVSSRARTEDDLSYSAQAVYDGSLPFENMFGSKGCGYLDFNYYGSLGYNVKQYIVNVTYISEDDDILGAETLYYGKERPTRVYGLKPLGSKACISMYAKPEDHATGYERFVGVQEVELSYCFVNLSAEIQNFSQIRDTDTAFGNGEKLELALHQSATKQDTDIRIQLIAENVDNSKTKKIYDECIQTGKFDSNGDLTWSIARFDVDPNDTASDFTTLDGGTYCLWAKVLYNVKQDETYSIYDVEKYQYMDYIDVGELTVLPTSSALTNVSHTVVSATQTLIQYEVNAVECESLLLNVYYGTDANNLNGGIQVSYKDYPGGACEGDFLLETEPETTYYYRAELIVNEEAPIPYSGENMHFTTPAASQEEPVEPDPEEPIVFTLLMPGEQSAAMEAGQLAYYETAAPNEDGVWSFLFSGADGYVCVWDDANSDWGEQIGFGIGEKSIVLPLTVSKDVPVKLMVFAYVADDYQINYALNEIVNHQNEKGIFVNAVKGECTFVASYTSTGQMLSVRRVETAGFQFVSVDPAADVVRVFRLDDAYAPVGGAAEEWR